MPKTQPPHNAEAEEALLGALLLDPGALDQVEPLLQPDDFYITRYGWVYEAMLALAERDEPADYIAVCDELERAGRLEQFGGPAAVSRLVPDVFRTANVKKCARIISRTAKRRRAIQAAGDLAASAYRVDQPLEAILEQHHERMEALAAGCAPPGWEWRTAAQACQPKPPRRYLVQPFLPLPSLTIVYGHPGTLKSMLLQDLAVCVSGGRPWLKPLPGNPTVGSYLCDKAPVLWLDVDNGLDRTERRFAALIEGHAISQDAPLRYVSFPQPPFVAGDPGAVRALLDDTRRFGARLVVVDNLGTVSGGADENSAAMIGVMAGLRHIAEQGEIAVVAVHHKSKGDRLRAGDSLRGHSSIESAVDLALLVQREEGSDVVTLRSTKSRDTPFQAISALWRYETEGARLLSGGFSCLGPAERPVNRASKAESAIMAHLEDGMNQTKIRDLVKERADVGRNTTLSVLKRLVRENVLYTKEGPHKSMRYYRANGDTSLRTVAG